MRARTAGVAAALLALTLVSCSRDDSQQTDPSKLDDSASLACEDFATGYKAATTRDARIELARKVNEWAKSSNTNGIADQGKALANGAAGGDETWKLGSDAFANACLEAGWKG